MLSKVGKINCHKIQNPGFQDSFFFSSGKISVIQRYVGNLRNFEESTNHLDEKLRCHQRDERRFVLQGREGGIYGRRRNSKDEITLRGIRESVVRTRQLGPNRDSPGRARELTRKFQIELAKLEGRPFNEMRSSTAMPKPYLRSPFFFLFFLPSHPPAPFYFLYFSRHFVFLIFFFFFSPSSELTLSIFSSRLEIFYLYLSFVRVLRVNFVPSHSSFRSNCHVNWYYKVVHEMTRIATHCRRLVSSFAS